MSWRAAEWLSALLGRTPERPATCLEEARVLAIAKAALDGLDLAPVEMPLVVADVTHTENGVVWHVDSMTRGAGVSIVISDADASVLELKRRHSR